MPSSIASTSYPIAGGSIALVITFYDEESAEVIPNTAKWTLLDADYAVINEKEDEAMAAAAATETILLQGADLVEGSCYVFVEWTYDSTLGNDILGNDKISLVVLQNPRQEA